MADKVSSCKYQTRIKLFQHVIRRFSDLVGSASTSSALMTVGVGGVCSLTSEALVNLNKVVPHPAYFDWRGWFRASLPFFRDDFEM
ncbi:hypothetical protein J6590_038444 [Homalodisca vitripennis]|nr:hypothetical protein J6590_038444 [Homalodisca vitripennis]